MLTSKSNLFTAVIVGVVGILLIVLHSHIDLLNWTAVAVGLMFVLPSLFVLCSGIGRKETMPPGTILVAVGGLIFGLLMCIFPSAFAGFFVYVFAALLIIMGVLQLVDISSWSKVVKMSYYVYIIPILLIATGIVILCTTLRDINTVVVLITGIALIASSLNTFIEYFATRKVSRP